MKRRTTLKVSVSPTRAPPERTRPVKRRHNEQAPDLATLQIDDDVQPSDRSTLEVYLDSLNKKSSYIAIMKQEKLSIGMPEHHNGIIETDRRLSYRGISIERNGDCNIGYCTCSISRSTSAKTLGDSRWVHWESLLETECIHLRAARSRGYVEEWMTERVEEEEVNVDTVDDCATFLDFPHLTAVVSLLENAFVGIGIVKRTKCKLTCLVCHRENCKHVIRSKGEMEKENEEGDGREDLEEEDDESPKTPKDFSSSKIKIDKCCHGSTLVYQQEEKWVINHRGIGDSRVLEVGKSHCCIISISTIPILFTSEKYGIETEFIELYAHFLVSAGTSLYGYHSSRLSYASAQGVPIEKFINRSSMAKAWRKYLDGLELNESQFTCSKCGQYPSVIIADGICLGSRADIGSSLPNRGSTTIATVNPGWMGTKRLRQEIRNFANGKTTIPINVPAPFLPFVESTSLADGSINGEYSDLLLLLFSDSPVPDILKVGMEGEPRVVMERLLNGNHDSTSFDHENDLIIFFPTLYKAIKPLWKDGALPRTLTQFIEWMITINDQAFNHPPHPHHFYGPIEANDLDFYPAWPMVRGLGRYDKDKRRDEMECSRKEIVSHSTLSPGVLLLLCPHRVTYGYSILDSAESPRSLFRVLSTRFSVDRMPAIVIYDNACHLSVYCISREPALFRKTSFLIDRLHSKNHKTCCRTLYLSEYDGDEDMKALNSQSAEQTNALLRHINHVLPFLKLSRFKKTLALFLAHNQQK